MDGTTPPEDTTPQAAPPEDQRSKIIPRFWWPYLTADEHEEQKILMEYPSDPHDMREHAEYEAANRWRRH